MYDTGKVDVKRLPVLIGSDKDPKAVEATQWNLDTFDEEFTQKFGRLANIHTGDFAHIAKTVKVPKGTIVLTNMPYSGYGHLVSRFSKMVRENEDTLAGVYAFVPNAAFVGKYFHFKGIASFNNGGRRVKLMKLTPKDASKESKGKKRRRKRKDTAKDSVVQDAEEEVGDSEWSSEPEPSLQDIIEMNRNE